MKMRLNKKIPSKKTITRMSLIFMALMIAVSVPITMVQKVSADQYDDKIAAINQDIAAYKAQISQLAGQVSTLQQRVSQLQGQINLTQNQINLSQAQYDQLVAKIAETEKQIKDNQDALGKTIASMYVDDQVTPLEMLASSKNIGDYLDKQEYRSSVRTQLTSTITKIKDLKIQLDKQQVDVKAVLDKQQAEKASLAAIQSEQQSLLDQTQGQESAYQQLVSSNQQKLNEVAAQQQAYYQSLIKRGVDVSSGVSGNFEWKDLSPGNGAGGCSGGYPYCGTQDTSTDPWALYNRECVSYVAWALESRFNRQVSSFSGSGNAYQWPYYAQLYSNAAVVSDPQPGDAVILPSSDPDPNYSGVFGDAKSTDPNYHNRGWSPLGHAMIVESVDGEWIHVSQFNMYGTGQYSTMDIKNAGIILLRFPSN